MKSIINTLLLVFATFLVSGQDTIQHLDHNNIDATLTNVGGFFSDPNTGSGYEIPKGDGVNAIYNASFWFAGEDASGNVFTTLGGYFGVGTDIDQGPFSTTNNYADPSYDQSFMVTICQEEIDQFNLWWECSNGVTTVGCANATQPSAETLTSIYDWPAHGDPSLGQSWYLAPFYDRDGDGTYDPIGQGDYPIIKGCCATYMIQNDAGNIHTYSGTDPIGIEMHYMFYHYGANDLLYNTTFVDVMAINKGGTDYVDFTHSFYVDGDVGNPMDDYIGTDSLNNMLFFYNGDNLDETAFGAVGYNENPPAIGVTALELPISSAIPYTSGSNFLQMNGLMASGAPWLHPDGYPTKYIFSGNPNSATAWNQTNSTNVGLDTRALMSTKYGQFNAGDTALQTYAVIYSRIGNNLENAEHLATLAAEIKAFYDSGDDGCDAGGFVSLTEISTEQILIYPNPTVGEFTISTPDVELKSLQIFDLTGKNVDYSEQSIGTALKINLEQNSPGVYLLYIETELGFFTKRIIVE